MISELSLDDLNEKKLIDEKSIGIVCSDELRESLEQAIKQWQEEKSLREKVAFHLMQVEEEKQKFEKEAYLKLRDLCKQIYNLHNPKVLTYREQVSKSIHQAQKQIVHLLMPFG